MSNMNADFTLVNARDRGKLPVLRQLINQRPDIDVIYVHVSHVCPTPNHTYLDQERIKLVVYSAMFYQDLLAMIIGDNASIHPDDVDENVSLDSTPALMGFCTCNQQTQLHILQPGLQ